MKNFGRKLDILFESPVSSEFKLDSACEISCKHLGAASASILIYSSIEDKLRCDGRYIDPKIGKININDNEILYKVMNHICACTYIYAMKDKLPGGDFDNLFEDFYQRRLIEDNISKDEFVQLAESFREWEDWFVRLKNAYRHEIFSIGIGKGTVTGEWYKHLLLEEKQIPGDILIKDLNEIEAEKKNLCMNYLKEEFQLTFTAQYYIALPLSVGGRNFGVLRLLSPQSPSIIKSTSGEIKIEENHKESLKEMAQRLSLHLAIDYLHDGHKETMLTSREIWQKYVTVENYLDSRCDMLSKIISCKGAVIRRLDKAKGIYKVAGCSKNLYDYRNYIENTDQPSFEIIMRRFARDRSILCVYFNFTDESFKVNEYVYHEDLREFSCRQEDPDLVGLPIKAESFGLSKLGIPNAAIFPFRHYPGHSMAFFNSENRPFRDEDIELLYPALQNFELELKEHHHLLETRKRMANIRQMHRDISKIFTNKNRKTYEYINDFLEEISQLIKKLELFPYHIIWECISQEAPGDLHLEENYILRAVTKNGYRNVPIRKNEAFDLPGDEYFQVPLTKQEFSEKFYDYFKSGTLEKVFEIPLKPGYSYLNLPVFSENESMPQWILTLIYREDNIDLVNDQDFFEFVEHFSHQIGLAWDKFQEEVTSRLLENIDFKLGGKENTKSHSTLEQLKIISGILAREIEVDWCAFFLVNEQVNALTLEAGNVELESRFNYSLNDQANIMVKCFTWNNSLRILGRERLEKIFTSEWMKTIEKEIRAERKKRSFKAGKHRFTPYLLFEHALFCPISLREKKLGLIILFRGQKTQKPQTRESHNYVTHPFSQFETHLLTNVQRSIFNIFVSHDAVQKRMRDIKNIIAQVISPISELITSTERSIPHDTAAEKITPANLAENLPYVNALSRITGQYVKNFEILLDIDTRKIKPKKEKIPDLRKYLIDFARLYTPLIRPKFIHIHVTDQTRSNISLEVDKDLFHVVISNILDNAIKYSFDPEDRLFHGLQAKPNTPEDKENVLITALENKNNINITVSSYGVEIIESESKSIFDKEFRGVHAPDRARGTGIGLYLAKEIIGMHEGTIRIVPHTPKHNTTFEITLPKGSNR